MSKIDKFLQSMSQINATNKVNQFYHCNFKLRTGIQNYQKEPVRRNHYNKHNNKTKLTPKLLDQ